MATNRFAKVFGRLAHSLQGPSRSKMEEQYLERAQSIYDLERRMQEIERGKFRHF